MRFFGTLLFLVASILVSVATIDPAAAQATRTWVSGVGDDANPCSRTAPCKTFAGAISKTAAGGEINVLDPGGFGAVTITKSISIIAEGSIGGVLVAGTNGIVVSAGASDVVTLYGLNMDGISKSGSGGLVGVKVLAGGQVNIINCFIHDFTTAGVQVVPSTTAVKVSVDQSKIVNSTIGVLSTAPTISGYVGVTRSALTANATAGVQADGAKARVVVSDTIIGFSTLDFSPVNSGQTFSYGNNTTLNSGLGTITNTNPLR